MRPDTTLESISEQVRNLERQNQAILFLSAINFFANALTIVLAFLVAAT